MRCIFDFDRKGFYLTPLIGFDWSGYNLNFWFGWGPFLFTWVIKRRDGFV